MDFFSKNIIFLRVTRGLKKSELPDTVGFNSTQWYNYEKGISKPKFDDLIKIVKYFEVSIDDLVMKDLSVDNGEGKLTLSEPESFYNIKGKPNGKGNGKPNDDLGVLSHLRLEYENLCMLRDRMLKQIEDKDKIIALLELSLNRAERLLNDLQPGKKKAG